MSNFNQHTNDLAAHAAAVEAAAPISAVPPAGVVINGATYIAKPGDDVRFLRLNNATAIVFTVPANATVPYPIDAEISGSQMGAGAITFAAAGGVVVNSRGGLVTTAGQYAVFMLKKVATDTWLLAGDLA